MKNRSLDPLEEAILGRIPWEILAGAVALGAATAFVFGALDGAFVLGGGAVSALGFLGMKKGLERVLAREKGKVLAAGLRLLGLRFVLILLILSLIILNQPTKLVAFAAGFSIVIPVFLVEALRAFSRLRQWKN